jgi:hypothetical protein
MTKGEASGQHRDLKAVARHEFLRFLVLFLYLWAMFLLFELHQYVVLSTYKIPVESWSIGFFNALVLAKVMVVADEVRFKTFLRDRPLFIAIVGRSIVFAILFIAVDVLEKVLLGYFHGQALAESVPTYGGGGLAGRMVVGMIIAISLIPYFAFREIDIKLGKGRLSEILFGLRAAPNNDAATSPR